MVAGEIVLTSGRMMTAPNIRFEERGTQTTQHAWSAADVQRAKELTNKVAITRLFHKAQADGMNPDGSIPLYYDVEGLSEGDDFTFIITAHQVYDAITVALACLANPHASESLMFEQYSDIIAFREEPQWAKLPEAFKHAVTLNENMPPQLPALYCQMVLEHKTELEPDLFTSLMLHERRDARYSTLYQAMCIDIYRYENLKFQDEYDEWGLLIQDSLDCIPIDQLHEEVRWMLTEENDAPRHLPIQKDSLAYLLIRAIAIREADNRALLVSQARKGKSKDADLYEELPYEWIIELFGFNAPTNLFTEAYEEARVAGKLNP